MPLNAERVINYFFILRSLIRRNEKYLVGNHLTELAFVDYIKDPIYGSVGITSKEKEVIETKVFQRLKYIKQLGTANFVYPGANHSRFEHSIGVMHATSLILDRLDIGKNCRQSIRLAVLLHDIGHGPFSHTFEELLTRNSACVPIINGIAFRDHEQFTNLIITEDVELKKALDFHGKDVCDFLSGNKVLGDAPSEIITGDMGSDRIDYLIRDTYYTGLGHRPDVDSLISSMILSERKSGCPRLTISKDGILAAELLITTRYYHYSMIAHHPKTRAVELLFLQLMESILKGESNPQGFVFDAYTKFDDSTILSKIFNLTGSLRNLFYSGKGLFEVFSIPLNEIRSGLAKYSIYRMFDDEKGLLSFNDKAGEFIGKLTNIGKISVDVQLIKHSVPEIILCSEKYETSKEWVSPFAIDHSNILKLIPNEQLLHSSIRVFCETKPDSNIEEIKSTISQHRSDFLSTDFLAPFTKDRISTEFQPIDYFYTFVSALRDYYADRPWKSDATKTEEVFRGIIRFYELSKICSEKLGIKMLKYKKFYTSENEKEAFNYSINCFTILNAFDFLDFMHLDHVVAKAEPLKNKPYRKVYLIKPTSEKEIRRRLYEGVTQVYRN